MAVSISNGVRSKCAFEEHLLIVLFYSSLLSIVDYLRCTGRVPFK